MNILYLSSWFPYPPDNGSRQRAYHLLKGLAARHSISFIAFTDEDQRSPRTDALEPFAREIVTIPRRAYAPGRARALIGLLSPQPRFLVDTFDAHARATIERVAANSAFDAIVASQLSMAVYAQHLHHPVRVFDELEVSIFADPYFKTMGAKRLRNGLTWLKFSRFVEDLATNFNVLTTASAREKSLLEQLRIPPQKIHVIPNGVDYTGCATIHTLVEPFSLIYNGALTYSANFDAMHYFCGDILPRIRAVEPRAHLRITGRASEVAQKELSEDNAVLFTGYVDDVRPLVAASAVCIVPLRVGGGTRLKILEAMALGTPVVSTSKGAEGLHVTNGEHLLLADSPHEFAQATLRLLNDDELRARLAAAARKRVAQEYDWHNIGVTFDETLERAVSRTGTVG